ncbi:MAG: hypothetical protein ACI4UN_01775, partial [Muribaculaceae bacterium]
TTNESRNKKKNEVFHFWLCPKNTIIVGVNFSPHNILLLKKLNIIFANAIIMHFQLFFKPLANNKVIEAQLQ